MKRDRIKTNCINSLEKRIFSDKSELLNLNWKRDFLKFKLLKKKHENK